MSTATSTQLPGLTAGSEERAQSAVGAWMAEGLAVESVRTSRGWLHRPYQVNAQVAR